MRKLHCRRRIISDPKTESDHHQPEHPPHGSFRQKFSLGNTLVLGVEGLNFLIYNDKEYLNIQCEDFSENLDFYFHTILREMDEQKESYETICQNLLEALISSTFTTYRIARRNASFLKKRLPANAVTQSASSILTSEKTSLLTHLRSWPIWINIILPIHLPKFTGSRLWTILLRNGSSQVRNFLLQRIWTRQRLQNSAASLLQAIFPNVSEKYAAWLLPLTENSLYVDRRQLHNFIHPVSTLAAS